MPLREQTTVSRFLICCFFKLPSRPKWHVASSIHTDSETDPSQLPLDDSNSDLGEPLLTCPGRAEPCRHFYYTHYRYFSEGVCSGPSPDILHHSETSGSGVLSVGKSTGIRLWVKLLQRASQKDCELLMRNQIWSSTSILLLTPAMYFQEVCCIPRDSKEGQAGKHPPTPSTCEISTLGSSCSFTTISSQCSCKALWTTTWKTARLLKESPSVQAMNYILHKK